MISKISAQVPKGHIYPNTFKIFSRNSHREWLIIKTNCHKFSKTLKFLTEIIPLNKEIFNEIKRIKNALEEKNKNPAQQYKKATTNIKYDVNIDTPGGTVDKTVLVNEEKEYVETIFSRIRREI
jgi:hypothetical protein